MKQFSSIALPLGCSFLLAVCVAACSERPEEKWFNFEISPSSERRVQVSERQPGENSRVAYEPEAFFAEISLPDISSVSGRAKLIRHSNPNAAIGYEMSISVDSLAATDIPDKYKKERTFQTPAGEARVMPLDEVTYKAKFIFDLKDKDGFAIRSVQSREHSIRSGETNRLKGRTPYVVDSVDAALTENMDVELSIVSCSSCREEE